jgi:gamma-glutamyl hercynylcysteine S-oxide synthase
LKSVSIQSCRESVAIALMQTRSQTLDLLSQIDESLFCLQVHPEFSPIGWHFGHIAFTEAYWILEYLADSSPSFPPAYQRLFAADGLPKQERQNLPAIATIKQYLREVRNQTLDYLETAPLHQQERLWRWLIQHESQHCETISFLWQLEQERHFSIASLKNPLDTVVTNTNITEMVEVPRGEFTIGSDLIEALDNERPAHQIYLDDYWIDRHPVTCRQYAQFMATGGYQTRQYWSKEGWQWLQQNPVHQPLYWSNHGDRLDHPVYGVSYFEAEAYANFVGKRLPTEAEWEKAAQDTSRKYNLLKCNHGSLIGQTTTVNTDNSTSHNGCQDMLGNVWEWTASWFAGYPGFAPYPYSGYSAAYFDQQHRVLRGGSWATSSVGLRTSFRNWYHPHVRQILAGFRCAKD